MTEGLAFRALLQRHREARRWSRGQLARAAKLDDSLITRLGSGVRNPTRDNIAKLVAALELAPAEADELWLAADFIPPTIPRETFAVLVATFRRLQREATP